MTKYLLAAGAAALALAAPAVAEKGGNGHGGNNHGAKQGGHGPAHAAKADKQRGGDRMVRGDMRGNDRKMARGPDRPRGNDKLKGRDERRDMIRVDRKDDDRRMVRIDKRDDVRYAARAGGNGLVDGCPPGLVGKGCMPPGQAKKKLGTRVPAGLIAASLPAAYYGDWYRDDPRYLWRADDDYLYRIDRETQVVSGLMPLFDTGYYPVGQLYPSAYNFYNVPLQYRDYYPAEADYLYRYGDGAIYAVDPQTNLVNSIVALVAGDLAVGQPMPSAYSVYNVPLDYRDRYADTANDWYRYNDGYIYRVDPTTQLVSAMVQAIL